MTIPAWVDGALRPMDKLDVHRRGLKHPAVSVFVFWGDRMLLQRRAAGKYHTPGLWANACCTHPAWDEPPEDCASRRLGEELGLWDLPLTWRERIEYRAGVGGGLTEHEVVDLFVAEASEEPVPRPDPAEVSETRWITAMALTMDVAARPNVYVPWLRIYMERHRDSILHGSERV